MASAAEYAQWIVQNADKRGTPEFETVARAYEAARRLETAPAPAAQPAVEPQRSMGDRIVGALETAGTMATGALAAPAAAVGGLVAGVGQQILSGQYDAQQASQAVDQYAKRIAGAMTMQPQTAAGREYVGAIGQVGEALGPMQGLVPQAAVITQAMRNAAPAMQTAATVGAIRAGEAAQQAWQRVQQGVQTVRNLTPFGRGRQEMAAPAQVQPMMQKPSASMSQLTAANKAVQNELSNAVMDADLLMDFDSQAEAIAAYKANPGALNIPDPVRKRLDAALAKEQQILSDMGKVRAYTDNLLQDAPPQVAFDDALLSVAQRESQAAGDVIKSAISSDAQGVMPGKLRQLDQKLASGAVSEAQVAQAYAGTRETLRQRYGDTVTLWRADAPDAEKNGGTRTVYMGDRALAEKFAVDGREAKPYQVKVDDILAVYAKPGGYYEAIVRRPGLVALEDVKRARTMGGSVGAAGAEAAAMREATAAQLPVPVTLTRGAATRDAQQLAFEKEAIKTEAGAPLRQRAEENNLQILQNFDVLIDDTGAQIRADPAAVGRTVTGALVESAAKDKARVRVAYKEAEKAGDMAAPVSTAGIAEFLDANVSAESTAGILGVARKELVRLGGATVDPDTGRLIPGELSINNMEQLRKLINKSKDTDATNGKFGRDVISAIDAATDGQGGEKYKTARALRRQYAEDYENRAIVANLLTNRRGMDDPRVAIDQVFRKSILNGSPEDIRFLRQVLDKGGENGAQAWRELQGATVEHIRSQAAQGLQTDSMGNAIVSPAKLNQTIRQLDSNGRLDLVLGKKQAQTLRDLNEVLQYVTTVPPGTLVNTSGTAGMLMAAMAETGALSMVGLPLPVLTGIKAVSNKMKDVKLRRRIDDALNAAKAKEKRERVTGQSL